MLWLIRVLYLLILHHCVNGLDFVLDIPSEIEHNTRHEVILSTVHGSVGERLSVAIRAEVRSNGAVVYPYSNQTLLISQHPTETHSLPFKLNPPATSCNSAVPGPTLCACEISVSITTSTGQNWSKSQGVKIIKTKGHIFIQTERPVYLPGEKVNVRFVPVDDQLRPLHVTMKMTIEAPNPLVGGSPLTSWSKTKAASRGIFSRSFFLPETPPLGKWTVSASFHSDQVTDTVFRSSFYVQEFTLPTFEVEITPHKEHFILPDDTDFSFSISARHIHGEKVDGSVYIRYGLVFDDGPDVSTLHRPYESLTSGRLEITQPLSSLLRREYSIGQLAAANVHLLIEATVIERNGGKMRTARNTHVVFTNQPIQLSFDATPSYYKPGLPFPVQIIAKHVNGSGAALLRINVRASVVRSDARVISLVEQSLQSCNEGRVSTTLTPPSNTNSLTIIATAHHISSHGNQFESQVRKTIHPQVSTHGEYLQIISPGRDLVMGSMAALEIHVTPSLQPKTVVYTVTNGNKLLLQSTGQIASNGHMITIPLTVTSQMSPVSHMTAYHVGQTSAGVSYIVADSLALRVEEVCKGVEPETLVSIPGEQIPLPGQQLNLDVTGQPSAFIGLSGVDNAALSLHHEYPYDTTMMTSYTRKNTFDILRSFQPGCKVPTIPTPESSFPTMGRVLLTSADHNFLGATTIQCEEEVAPRRSGRRRRRRRSIFADSTLLMAQSYRGGEYDCCAVGARDISTVLHITGENPCKQRTDALDADEKCKSAFYHCCLEAECIRAMPWKSARPCRGVSPRSVFPEVASASFPSSPSVDRTIQLLRRNFDLTWFNVDFQLGPTGRMTLNEATNPRVPKLPDSITFWSISTFSLSNDTGMCVAPEVRLPVEHSLFIEVTLPHHKVVRGTQVSVEVTAYSYLPSSVQASIILEPTPNLCTSEPPGQESSVQGTIAPSRDGVASTMVTRFVVMPTTHGDYKIKVKLLGYHHGTNQRPQIDKVVKILKVVPEGTSVRKVEWVLVDTRSIRNRRSGTGNRGNRGNRGSNHFNLPLPPSAIPGTEKATIQLHSISSAILSEPKFNENDGSLNTIAQYLYQLQSVVSRFQYLRSASLLTEENRNELAATAQSAYIGLLTYARDLNDSTTAGESPEPIYGFSFSPASNSKPDLWLSTATLRLIVQSAELISIDENILNGAIRWILSHQVPRRGYFSGKPMAPSRGSRRRRSSCLSKTKKRCRKRRNFYSSFRKYKMWKKKCRKRIRRCIRKRRSAEVLLKLPQFTNSYERKIYRTSIISSELHVIYTTIETWEGRGHDREHERTFNVMGRISTSPLRRAVRRSLGYIKRQMLRQREPVTSTIVHASMRKTLFMLSEDVFHIVAARLSDHRSDTSSAGSDDPTLTKEQRLQMKSALVESTAYQLHLLTLRGRPGEAYVNWLIRNRNSNGRWVSLRDSLAASQALSGYVNHHHHRFHPSISLEVPTLSNGNQIINANNVNQPTSKVEVPTTTNQISMATIGEGVAWLELDVEYSEPRSPTPPTPAPLSAPTPLAAPTPLSMATEVGREEIQYCPYNINVRIDNAPTVSSFSTLRTSRISHTARLVSLSVSNKTNVDMSESSDTSYIVEFGLHSDYYPDIENLQMLFNPVERTLDHYKITKRALIFYMSGPRNISFKVTDSMATFSSTPIPVTVYPTAFPERRCTTYYNQRGPSRLAALCSADNQDMLTSSDICLCASAQTCPRVVSRATSQSDPVDVRVQSTCDAATKYAYKVKIVSKSRQGEDWMVFRGRIRAVYRGMEGGVGRNQIHTFWMKILCNSERITVNKEYLIVGVALVQGSDGVFKHLLEANTRVEWWPSQSGSNSCARKKNATNREICEKMVYYNYHMINTGCP